MSSVPVTKTPLAQLNVVIIPSHYTAAEIADLKAANVGSGFVQVMAGTATQAPVTVAATQSLSIWGQLAEGILAEGATLIVPGPWIPWVDKLINFGVPEIESLFSKNPTVETWTAETLQAQMVLVAATLPQT